VDAAAYRWVNRLQQHTAWLHGTGKVLAVDGILVFAVLLVVGWWQARSAPDAPDAVARVVWAGGASLVGFVAVQLIGGVVDRARPYTAMPASHVLVARSTDFSFPSDHGTAAGAIATGLVLAAAHGSVRRWVATVGVVTAVALAAARVYVGVHYPGDVVAGLALGALVAVAGAPLAQRALGPAARWVLTTPLAPLVARRVPAVSG